MVRSVSGLRSPVSNRSSVAALRSSASALAFVATLTACHAQSTEQGGATTGAGGSGGASSTASSTAMTGASSSTGIDPCSPFIQSVVSVSYGPGAGFGQDRFPQIVEGPPQGGGAQMGGTDVLGLGKGGSIVVAFGDQTIVDLPGPDFIVFENPFYVGGDPTKPFAELGTVSVSEDGQTWVTFPCTASSYPYGACAGWHAVYANPTTNAIDPRDPAVAGGDAFDLADVGVKKARFIRIVDRADFPAGDFDLDAIAIVRDAAGSHSVCAAP